VVVAAAAALVIAVAPVALVGTSEAASHQKTGATTGAAKPVIVFRGGKFTNPSLGAIATWLPSKPADYRISYDDTAINTMTGLTYGDLRLPKAKRPKAGYPVAVIIHGGGWTSSWGHDYVDPFAESLTRAGVATWNFEYRRVGNPGGGWPGTFLDVAHGTDFLRKLAPRFHLDLNRVVVIGHSAGGHLAVWDAARHKIPKDSPIYTPNPLPLRGAVSLDGQGPGVLSICPAGEVGPVIWSRHELPGSCGSHSLMTTVEARVG
jgi:pimeloyl-ACP methyl ester carboxylesterase